MQPALRGPGHHVHVILVPLHRARISSPRPPFLSPFLSPFVSSFKTTALLCRSLKREIQIPAHETSES
eukprot:COSAG03_NODE_508_length_7337_cov_6.411854_4_plen_68_part_00